MIIPEVKDILETRPTVKSIVIFGIEVKFYTVPFHHVLTRLVPLVSCLRSPNCSLPAPLEEIHPSHRD